MAAEYAPDLPRTEAELIRFRETEASARKRREVLATANEWPSGKAVLGDLDGYLAYESDRFDTMAQQLRRELGHRFIAGSHSVRSAIVRDWLRNFRKQGRLPPL